MLLSKMTSGDAHSWKTSQRPWLVTPRWGSQSQTLRPLTRVSQVTNEGCPCPAGKGKWKRQQTSVIEPDEPRENGDEHRKTERVVWTLTHTLLASSKSICPHQGLSPGQGRSKSGSEQHKQTGHSCLSLRTPHRACPTLTPQIPQQD